LIKAGRTRTIHEPTRRQTNLHEKGHFVELFRVIWRIVPLARVSEMLRRNLVVIKSQFIRNKLLGPPQEFLKGFLNHPDYPASSELVVFRTSSIDRSQAFLPVADIFTRR
jgi:hypothetical protein